MALKDFVAPSTTISFARGEFAVHGISFDDLAALFTSAQEEVLGAIDRYDQMAGGEGGVDRDVVIFAMLKEFPALMARVIAQASGEPDAIDQARKLPLSVQMDALAAIGSLTFEEPESLKKFIAHIANLMSKVTMLGSEPKTIQA